LSHKGSDKPKVRQFKATLELLGLRPWLDEDAMPAGTELERGISQGFKDSCAVVFFVTPDFKDENFLATEVNYAIREKRTKDDQFQIITLCLHGKDGDKGQVPELLQPYVWKTPHTDLEALQEILKALPIRVGGTQWKDGFVTPSPESPTNSSRKNKQLTTEAAELLTEATSNDRGILALRTLGGFHVQAGNRSFGIQGDSRSEATWQAALEELVRRGFIRDRGHKGEVFGVTKEGFEFADSIAAQDEVVNIILNLSLDEIGYLMTMSRPRNQAGIPSDFFDSHSGRDGERYHAMIEHFVELNLMRYASGVYKITATGYEVTDRLWQVLLLRIIGTLREQGRPATSQAIAESAVLTDGELEAKECGRLLDELKKHEHIVEREVEGSSVFDLHPKADVIQRPLRAIAFKPLD
jgi:hypothetical protein